MNVANYNFVLNSISKSFFTFASMLIDTPEKYMLPCLNKKLFGFDCMGCGIQRSAVLVTKGEFTEAFIMYPAIYSLGALFICIVLNFFF